MFLQNRLWSDLADLICVSLCRTIVARYIFKRLYQSISCLPLAVAYYKIDTHYMDISV